MTTNDEQYVPSEGAVKFAWADRRLFLDSMGEGNPQPDDIYNAEFDRFLARVRRDAAERAWEECAEMAAHYGAFDGSATRWLSSINPHRAPEEAP